MKYLHIYTGDNNNKFLSPLIIFINQSFNPEDHLFLVNNTSSNRKGFLMEENVKLLSKDIRSLKLLYKSLKSCEKIIIHGLSNKKIVFLFFLKPQFLKKCNWIVWGGDLHYYKNRKRDFKNNVYENIRRTVIKKMNEISTLVPEDYNLVKSWYKTNAKYYHAIYTNLERNSYLNQLITQDNPSKSYIAIQVGNSNSSNNNHIEVLDYLKKYREENIRVYCPLAYGGNSGNARIVNEYGQQVLGDKFIPMSDFMNINDYMDFLNNIDVAIFNNDRQQALGNIYPLLYLGKKVYMREDTTMWKELVKQLDLRIYNLKLISKFDFNSFIKFDTFSKNRNNNILKERFDTKYITQVWERIFKGKG